MSDFFKSIFTIVAVIILVIFTLKTINRKNNNSIIPKGYQDTPGKHYDKYYSYKKVIDKNNIHLRRLAAETTKSCAPNNKECMMINIYEYVRSRINYLGDPVSEELIQTPMETLSLKAGDCEDLAILLSSILYNVGIKSYLVHVPGHIYTLGCGIDTNNFKNELKKKYQTNRHLFKTNKYFSGRSLWHVQLNKNYYREPLNIKLKSSKPVDLYALDSKPDINRLMSGQSYTYMPDCTYHDIKYLETSCYLAAGNIIALKIKHEETRVNISGTGKTNIPKTPRFYDINNEKCITLDPAIKGNAGFAGMEMEIYKNSEKKIISLN